MPEYVIGTVPKNRFFMLHSISGSITSPCTPVETIARMRQKEVENHTYINTNFRILSLINNFFSVGDGRRRRYPRWVPGLLLRRRLPRGPGVRRPGLPPASLPHPATATPPGHGGGLPRPLPKREL